MHTRRGPRLAIAFLAISAIASVASAEPSRRCEAGSSVDSLTEQQALRAGIALPLTSDVRDVASRAPESGAVDEMVRGTRDTPLRWESVPELVILTSVMQYEKGRTTEFRATAHRLTQDEAMALVADLTDALATLTDNTLTAFSAVRFETASADDVVSVMRPGQIVVARYAGVRDQLATIGFGGRSTRGTTIRAGSIILDSEFDRTDEGRRLLRMHELGHALGYNHVQSRVSIMNPKIGPGPTDVDRAIARVAFRDLAPAASSCPLPVG